MLEAQSPAGSAESVGPVQGMPAASGASAGDGSSAYNGRSSLDGSFADELPSDGSDAVTTAGTGASNASEASHW